MPPPTDEEVENLEVSVDTTRKNDKSTQLTKIILINTVDGKIYRYTVKYF